MALRSSSCNMSSGYIAMTVASIYRAVLDNMFMQNITDMKRECKEEENKKRKVRQRTQRAELLCLEFK